MVDEFKNLNNKDLSANARQELESEVLRATKRAVSEYYETLEILAEYDRSNTAKIL